MQGHTKVQALIDSGSKDNTMISAYTAVLELHVCFTNIEAQKIDGSIFSTYDMVLANF